MIRRLSQRKDIVTPSKRTGFLGAGCSGWEDRFENGVLSLPWAWDNQATASATFESNSVMGTESGLILTSTTAGTNYRWLFIDAPTTAQWVAVCKIHWRRGSGSVGLAARDTASGKTCNFGLYNGAQALGQKTTAATVVSSNNISPIGSSLDLYTYFSIVKQAGTNINFRASSTPIVTNTLGGEAIATFLGGIDKIGLHVNGACAARIEWFRVFPGVSTF